MNVPTCKACEACNTNDRITSFVCISDYLFTMSSVISCLFHHYIHTLHTSFVCIFSLPFTATSSGILLPFFTLFFLLMCLSVLPRLVSPGCHFPMSSLCIYSSALLVSYQSFCFAASLPACIHVYPSV